MHIVRACVLVFALSGTCLEALSEDESLLKGSIRHDDSNETRIHRIDDGLPVPPAKSRLRIHHDLSPISADDFTVSAGTTLDCEAEANSKVLTLAWEAWHKQLMKNLYSKLIPSPEGACLFTLVVTKDQHISIMILAESGNPIASRNLVKAVRRLEGNPGLTFPQGSKREKVEMTYSFESGRKLQNPGYTWKKGDVETIFVDK